MACRDGAHDGACPAPILFQMVERESEDLVWCQPGPILIHNSKTIRVSIEAESHLRFALPNEIAYLVHSFRIRFRMMSAEEGIKLVVESGDFGASFLEEGIEVAASGPIHQFHRQLHAGAANRGK